MPWVFQFPCVLGAVCMATLSWSSALTSLPGYLAEAWMTSYWCRTLINLPASGLVARPNVQTCTANATDYEFLSAIHPLEVEARRYAFDLQNWRFTECMTAVVTERWELWSALNQTTAVYPSLIIYESFTLIGERRLRTSSFFLFMGALSGVAYRKNVKQEWQPL